MHFNNVYNFNLFWFLVAIIGFSCRDFYYFIIIILTSKRTVENNTFMYVYSFFLNFSFYFITLTIHPLLLLLYVIVIRFNYIFRNWLQNVVTFIQCGSTFRHLGIHCIASSTTSVFSVFHFSNFL
jgi:hypothetical protein